MQAKRLHIQHITTTAFHPCSNGMVERCHRQLKDALRARSEANDWPDHLPWVLLGLRAAPKEESVVSLAEMVLGDPLVLPGSRQGAAAASAVLRGLVIGGPNPPCPYETSYAGPIRAPGVHKRLRQERRHPSAVCVAAHGALRGPGVRREGFPAAGDRQRGGGVCGPPQAAQEGGASAASGAAKARSAASSTTAAFGRQR